MSYNEEEDTKLHLISPGAADHSGQQLTMEYPITAGQIVLGDGHRQLAPGSPITCCAIPRHSGIAVVEAKEEAKAPGAGLPQAKEYAKEAGAALCLRQQRAWLRGWDFTTHTQSSLAMATFPSPDELWQRQCAYDALAATRAKPAVAPILARPRRPAHATLLSGGRRQPRARSDPAWAYTRILINLATGTGKTFIAAQIVWKLLKSGYFANDRVLFLANRVVLRDQAYNAFELFNEGGSGQPGADRRRADSPPDASFSFRMYRRSMR